MDAPSTEASRELDELRLEVAELRASRMRLLLGADAERRAIERALHDGLQQQLVGLAAELELAAGSVETDPPAATRHLADIRHAVREALEEMRTLASRIHPALEAGGLGTALRFAAANADVRTRIDVALGSSVPAAIAGAVYFCCLEVLERAADASITITVRDDSEGLTFEVVADGQVDEIGPALRDRVEALSGSLDTRSEPGPRTVWIGFLPVER